MRVINKISRPVIDFLYGLSVYEISREFERQQAELNALFMLSILGNSLGLPLFPPSCSLRLWPYLLPQIGAWKRSILRPKGLRL